MTFSTTTKVLAGLGAVAVMVGAYLYFKKPTETVKETGGVKPVKDIATGISQAEADAIALKIQEMDRFSALSKTTAAGAKQRDADRAALIAQLFKGGYSYMKPPGKAVAHQTAVKK